MNQTDPPARRLRPRFSLRTLLILTLFAGGMIRCVLIFSGPAWISTRKFNSGSAIVKMGDPGEVLAKANPILSKDGTRLAVIDGSDLTIFNTENGEEIAKLKDATPWTGEFSSDNTRLITAGDGGKTRLWNATNGKEVTELDAPDNFSLDGKLIVSIAQAKPGYVHIRDGLAGAPLGGFGYDGYALASPRGDRILVQSKDVTRLYESISGKELCSMGKVWFAQFDPPGNQFVTFDADNHGVVWDATTGNKRVDLEKVSERRAVFAFSADGSRFAMDGECVAVWDTKSGAGLAQFPEHDAWELTFMQDKHSLFLRANGKDRIYNAVSGNRIVLDTEGDIFEGNTLACVDDTRVALKSAGDVKVINFSTGEVLANFQAFEGNPNLGFLPLFTVHSSHGGHTILTVGNTTTIWQRRRPEKWLAACFALPEVWLTILLACALIWSILRDRSSMNRLTAQPTTLHPR
jgi:WD40 repeat protein